jgi:hypothetical protein
VIPVLFALALGVMPVGTSIVTAADGSLQCHASGDIEIIPDGKTYINGVDVHIGDNGTQDVIVLPTRTLFLKYTPADAGSWTGTPPAYVWDALSRLAAALAASGHKP